MKRAYNRFKKFYPLILTELFLTVLFGTLSFQFYYNTETCTLKFKNVISVIFLVLVFASIATVAYFSFTVKDLKITHIRKQYGFLRFSSMFAAIMLFTIFVYRFIQIVTYPEGTAFFRVAQFLLCIPLIAYLIINILPNYINKKKVYVPKGLKYVLSVCTVLWAIFGVFSMYFYNEQYFFTTNIFKISQILIYAVFAAFFLYEAKFEYLTPNYKMYLFTSLLSAILTFAFSAGAVIPKITGSVPSVQSLSEIEVICTLSIGIYALSRFFAVFKTVNYVMNEDSDSRRHSHHHHRKPEDKSSSN